MEKFIKKKILRKIKNKKVNDKNIYFLIDKIKGIKKKLSSKYKSKFSKLC